jgi:hypothetical protein
MKLNDYRTVHRSITKSEVHIMWAGDSASGSYSTWLTEDFTDETIKLLVDGWVKEWAPEATDWSYTLNTK